MTFAEPYTEEAQRLAPHPKSHLLHPSHKGHNGPATPTRSPQEGKMSKHQPDKVTAKSNDKPFPIHPEGQYAARCVDVIDLGEAVISFPGKPSYLANKVALGFYTGQRDAESGQVVNVMAEFTLSMGKKANMRKFLEGWRGKKYTDEQAKEGVPVDKLFGVGALISVEHNISKNDRKYANIVSVAPLPSEMAGKVPKVEAIEYTRDEWWTKKREAYTKEAQEFRKAIGAPSEHSDEGFEEFPSAQDGDDDLPF